MRVTVDGNEAAASAAYRLNEVCCIYPITPSSPMAELADDAQDRPSQEDVAEKHGQDRRGDGEDREPDRHALGGAVDIGQEVAFRDHRDHAPVAELWCFALSGVSALETKLGFSGREDFWIIGDARSEDETEIRAGETTGGRRDPEMRRATRRHF